jgi:hypothetical protein
MADDGKKERGHTQKRTRWMRVADFPGVVCGDRDVCSDRV